MFVIVGLGNPGKEYAMTRHNMGFMALDLLAERHHLEFRKHAFRSFIAEGMIGAHKVVLAKPETFMNNSGWAVMDLMNWYKPEHDELVLLYDDIELPAGDIRVREKGSSGTHNGMRSVIYQLGFDDFPRVRMGIGGPKFDLIDHVLSAPQGEERELLIQSLQKAADATELIVKGEIREAATRFNRRKKPPKPPKEEEAKAVPCAETETAEKKASPEEEA